MFRIVSSILMLASLLSAEVDWRFAHPGAELLMGMNLKSLVSSPAGALLREALADYAILDRLKLLQSVDEIYVSVRSRYVKGRPAGEPLGVILVRGNFENGAIMKLFENQPKLAARFLDKSAILLGDEESMTKAVERLKSEEGLVTPMVMRAKELSAGNDFWVVGSPAPLAGFRPRGSLKRQGGIAGEMEEIFDSLRSFSMGVALRDELSLEMGFNLRTKAAADHLMAMYQKFEADLKKTPESLAMWDKMEPALEVHPNGTSVRFRMKSDMANLEQVVAQTSKGMTPAAEATELAVARPPVPAPLPVAPVEPVRGTVKIYGMESGYREIPLSKR